MSSGNLPAKMLMALPLVTALAIPATPQETAPIMPQATTALLLDIAPAGAHLVAVGEHGVVLHSDDSGSHWQQSTVPTTRMLTGIHFADDRHGWAVGHDGLILVSDDSGEHWRIQRDGLAVQLQANLELREAAHHYVEELEQRLATAGGDTREQIEIDLEDARADLEDANLVLKEPVFASPFMDVWFQNPDRGWAVGAFGTLVATEDGGQHWVSQNSKLDNPDEFHLNTITGDGKGRVFVAGEGGVLFRSLDSGNTWESLPPFYEGSWFGVVYTARHDALLLFGLRGNLYRSTDFGTSWQPVVTDNTMTLAGGSYSASGDIVLVGGAGSVLTSTDGGVTFQKNVLKDRLNLSSGMRRDGILIVVGQGGVKAGNDGFEHE